MEQKDYIDYPKTKEYEIEQIVSPFDCYDMPVLAGIYLSVTSPQRLTGEAAEQWKRKHYVGSSTKKRWL